MNKCTAGLSQGGKLHFLVTVEDHFAAGMMQAKTGQLKMYVSEDDILLAGDCLVEGRYRLHSRFREVVNYRGEADDICFVTTCPGVMAANALLVRDPALLQADAITVDNEVFLLGSCQVERRRVATFDSRLALGGLSAEATERALTIMLRRHSSLFPPESMLYLLFPKRMEKLTKRFDKLCAERASEAAGKLLHGEMAGGMVLLRGLGRGLSPAGDDFIAGLLYSLHLHELWSGEDHSRRKDQVLGLALGENLLVNSFLRHAREGRCLSVFKSFVFSLSQKELTDVSPREVLSHGATSGADLLAGFVFGILNRKRIW